MNAERGRSRDDLIVATLAIVGIPYILLQSLAPTAIPAVSDEFGVSVSASTWLLTAYLISASVMTPLAGRIGDLIGKRRVLLVVLWAMAAGTVISAAAPNLPILILGRLVQGVGAASFPLAYGLIRDTQAPERVPGGIGLVAAAFGIGGFVGVSVAGPAIEAITYHGLFLACGAVAVIAAVGVHLFVPHDGPSRPLRIHTQGAAWMTLALVALLLPLGNGNSWGWLSPVVIGLFVLGLVAVFFWVRSELHTSEPLVDMRTLRQKPVWTANLATVMLGFGMFATFVLYPQMMVADDPGGFGLGVGLATTGFLFIPSSIGSIVSARVAGRLYHRVGGALLTTIGMIAAAVSYAAIGVLETAFDSTVWPLIVFGFISGLGIGTALASLTTYLLESVEPSATAVVTGINSIARTTGGAIGSQVAAALIALGGVGSVAVTSQGFLVGSLVATAVVVAAAAVMLLLAPAPGRSVDELEAEAVPEPVPMLEPMELGVAAPHDGRPDRPR
jgi:predicted MFS family arabinose efflux permease